MSGKPTSRNVERANQQHTRMESEREEEAEAQLSENTGMDLVAMAPAERTGSDAEFREILRDALNCVARGVSLETRRRFARPGVSDTSKDDEWFPASAKRQLVRFWGAEEASRLMWAHQDFLFDYFMPMLGNTLELAWKRRVARASSVEELVRYLRIWKEASQGTEGSQGESKQEAADGALVEEVDE